MAWAWRDSGSKKFILFCLFVCVSAHARRTSSSSHGPLHFTLQGSVAYSKASVTSGSEPTLIQWGGAATLGFVLGKFFLGGTANYHYVGQQSAVEATTGNFQGNRFNIVSPTIGMYLGDFVTQVEVQFLGEYRLLTLTAGGAELSYRDPLGGRLTVLYPISGRIHVGGFFEYTMFDTEFSTITGPTDLAEGLRLWQAGTALSVFF